MTIKIELTETEFNTIQAALRMWQEALFGGHHPVRDFMEIATDDGEHVPLSHEEVHKLCERLNCNYEVCFQAEGREDDNEEIG